MNKIILAASLTLLAACGTSESGVSTGSATAQKTAQTSVVSNAGTANADTVASTAATTKPTEPATDDTINVSSFGEMPKQCRELFTSFLKQIEPITAKIDWQTATVADFEALDKSMTSQQDDLDAKITAAGCDKYNLDLSNSKILDQLVAIANAEAPGTTGYLKFIAGFIAQAGAASEPGTRDCASTIAAIEPFLATGKTMKDLTAGDLATLSGLMAAVGTKCTPEEAEAFYQRDDVTAFVGG
jgi:hypothetical protein